MQIPGMNYMLASMAYNSPYAANFSPYSTTGANLTAASTQLNDNLPSPYTVPQTPYAPQIYPNLQMPSLATNMGPMALYPSLYPMSNQSLYPTPANPFAIANPAPTPLYSAGTKNKPKSAASQRTYNASNAKSGGGGLLGGILGGILGNTATAGKAASNSRGGLLGGLFGGGGDGNGGGLADLLGNIGEKIQNAITNATDKAQNAIQNALAQVENL